MEQGKSWERYGALRAFWCLLIPEWCDWSSIHLFCHYVPLWEIHSILQDVPRKSGKIKTTNASRAANFDRQKKDENFKMQQKGAWPLDDEASRVNSKICFKRRPSSAKVQIVNTFDEHPPPPSFLYEVLCDYVWVNARAANIRASICGLGFIPHITAAVKIPWSLITERINRK